MSYSVDKVMRNARAGVAVLAISAAVGSAGLSACPRGRSPGRRILFKAMSDYLAAQSMISFDYDASFEMVTKQDQKIAFTSSGSVTLEPARQASCNAHGRICKRGNGVPLGRFCCLARTQTRMPRPKRRGSIDNLVDVLRDKYHMPLPAADLLMSNAYDQLMPLVTDVKDLGTGVIRGDECDHLAFRTEAGRLSDLDPPGRPP